VGWRGRIAWRGIIVLCIWIYFGRRCIKDFLELWDSVSVYP